LKLGEIDPATYTIKGIGAIHLARWMGTLPAGIKADLLSKHVSANMMSAEDLECLLSIASTKS
jgi:hypothetical protein